MRAAIITGLSRRHSGTAASLRHRGKGVMIKTMKPMLLTIASVIRPPLKSWAWAVAPGSTSRKGRSGKVLPRANAEKASIHCLPISAVTIPC
jgi:hypothetical protein